jgi:hypothetical protein
VKFEEPDFSGNRGNPLLPGVNNRRISFFPLITFVDFQKKETHRTSPNDFIASGHALQILYRDRKEFVSP